MQQHRTREFSVILGARLRRLPVLTVDWLDERPRDVCGRRRSPCTMPGYRKGQKPPNAGRRFPADPPTADEFRAILEQCPCGSVAGARNRALLVLLRRSGLRISEALALRPGDVDPDACSVLVRCGKGGKTRRVGIDRQALALLDEWLIVRTARGFTATQPLFPTVEGPTKGGTMRSAYVRSALKRYAEQAGITKRVAPHQLRHGLAVELVRRKVSMPIVQRQLGHGNLSTTATYLASIAPQEVLDVMAGLEWDA